MMIHHIYIKINILEIEYPVKSFILIARFLSSVNQTILVLIYITYILFPYFRFQPE